MANVFASTSPAAPHELAKSKSIRKSSRNDRPSVIVLWLLLIALFVAFMVTYAFTIHNLKDYHLISLSTGPRLASDLAFLVALLVPPTMTIIFFVYWSHRFLRTPRRQREAGFLGALRVSFLGVSALLLQAGLIMQSYHAHLQDWTGGGGGDTTDVNNVEAALEAAFGLGYMLAGLLLVGFFVLLDSSAATTLFCSPLDDAGLGSLSELQRAHLSQEAAEVYALRGLQHMSQGTSASRGASSVPRYPPSAGERDQSGSLFAPDGASKAAQMHSTRSAHSRGTTAGSGSSADQAMLLNVTSGARHSRGPSATDDGSATRSAASHPGAWDARPSPAPVPASTSARSLGWRLNPPAPGRALTGTLGATTEWTDFQRVAEGCEKPLDELEVALDAMCAMQAPFYHRYEILSAVDRRVGGQGLVQYAALQNNPDRVAIKFYMDLGAFRRERELYMESQLKAMMPATLAIEDNAGGACCTPYGYAFPPFVIIECGQSLDEWARRNEADFITIFQSLSHAVRALVKLHSVGYAHRDIKPGNILRRPNQHDWTLIDFGCAAQIGSVAPLSYSLRYAPPEVIRALESGQTTIKADPAVDIWAIGVIAYELLTGERALHPSGLDPVTAETAALNAISGRSHLPWERPDAGPQLDKLRGLKRTVLRCLERDPARRPAAQALLKSWDHTFDNMQSHGTVFTRTASAAASTPLDDAKAPALPPPVLEAPAGAP